jgi:hypothetical protein
MANTDLIDVIDNEYQLYDQKVAAFDRWVAESDRLTEDAIKQLALELAAQLASMAPREYGRFSRAEIVKGAHEMLSQLEEHERYTIEKAKEIATAPIVPSKPMDEGAREHFKKYDKLAREIGIQNIVPLIPVSPEKVRYSLEHGDPYLNWIPLRLWDAAAAGLPTRSLSEGVSLLKHVAMWHYA